MNEEIENPGTMPNSSNINAGSSGTNTANTGNFGNVVKSQNFSEAQSEYRTFEDNAEKTGKNEEPGQTPPKYAHYQFRQDRTQQTMEGEILSENKKKAKGNKKQNTFTGKLGTTVALAVVFGLVAGLVFQGVNIVTDKYTGTTERISLATTDTVSEVAQASSSLTGEELSETVAQGGTVASVAQAAMPSVVAITSVSIQEIPNFYGFFGRGGTQQYQSEGSGSGIIVGENDDELLIATNNHVVEDATTLSVCFIGNDVTNAEQETENIAGGEDINVEDAVSAKIKGTDTDNDLAVIAVDKKDIPEETLARIKIAQIGNSDELVVGEQVVAIGNALGYGQSVTSGWVSALNRTVTTDSGTSSELIQTDAAINPGNSGGALLNMRGELIGINAAKYASSSVEGMGYAIPISKAQPILEELMNRKTREKVDDQKKAAYLGVEVMDLSTEAIQMYNMPVGAFVYEVTEGEAAEQSGIKRNDIITQLDGQKISSKSDLLDRLQYYTAGEEVEIVISRSSDGEYKEQTLLVTLGSRSQS
jgi:serine protease Do